MNKQLKTFILIVYSQFFMSCSSSDSVTLNHHHWTCDTGVVVDWFFKDRSAAKIELRLDGVTKPYVLDKIYTTDTGTLFSNGELAFRLKERAGVLFWAINDDIIGNHCVGN